MCVCVFRSAFLSIFIVIILFCFRFIYKYFFFSIRLALRALFMFENRLHSVASSVGQWRCFDLHTYTLTTHARTPTQFHTLVWVENPAGIYFRFFSFDHVEFFIDDATTTIDLLMKICFHINFEIFNSDLFYSVFDCRVSFLCRWFAHIRSRWEAACNNYYYLPAEEVTKNEAQ